METGLIRVKNAAHTVAMNLMVYAVGMTGFFVMGFALMCGGANSTFVGGPGMLGGIPVLDKMFTIHIGKTDWGLFGQTGFFLAGRTYDAAAVVCFLFMMVFMDTTATIPTGTSAERWKFTSFLIFSFMFRMILKEAPGIRVGAQEKQHGGTSASSARPPIPNSTAGPHPCSRGTAMLRSPRKAPRPALATGCGGDPPGARSGPVGKADPQAPSRAPCFSPGARKPAAERSPAVLLLAEIHGRP